MTTKNIAIKYSKTILADFCGFCTPCSNNQTTLHIQLRMAHVVLGTT